MHEYSTHDRIQALYISTVFTGHQCERTFFWSTQSRIQAQCRCHSTKLRPQTRALKSRGGSRIFFRRGCTRLLLYFNTNKPHSFFLQNTSCIRKPQVISRGGGKGAHPLHPPPRSGPEKGTGDCVQVFFVNSKANYFFA